MLILSLHIYAIKGQVHKLTKTETHCPVSVLGLIHVQQMTARPAITAIKIAQYIDHL